MDISTSRTIQTMQQNPNHFLLRPASGKDLDKALRRMNGLVARAKMRREFHLRKRYEKPHKMRRRLRQERWRRYFAAEIGRRVNIVKTLQLRGL